MSTNHRPLRAFTAVAGLALLSLPLVVAVAFTGIGRAPTNLLAAAPSAMVAMTDGDPPAADPNATGAMPEETAPATEVVEPQPLDEPASAVAPVEAPVAEAKQEDPAPAIEDASAPAIAPQRPEFESQVDMAPGALEPSDFRESGGPQRPQDPALDTGPARSGPSGSTALDMLKHKLGYDPTDEQRRAAVLQGHAEALAMQQVDQAQAYVFASRGVVNGQLFPGASSAIGAENAAAGIWAYVQNMSMVVLPRRYDATNPEWMATLRFESVESAAQMTVSAGGAVEIDGNDVRIDHGDVTEWYKNSPRGLKHGFTLHRVPGDASDIDEPTANLGGEVRVNLSFATNLVGEVRELGRALRFLPSGGTEGFWYRELCAFDATGRDLPARLEQSPGSVSIVVDAANAVYPIEIDPLIVAISSTISSIDSGFGTSVAINRAGNLMAIGSPRNGNGQASGTGSVSIYELISGSWTLQREAFLGNLPFFAGAALGTSVDVVDGYVVAGAPTYRDEDTAGGVLVIKKGASWAVGSTTDTVMINASPWFLNDGLCGNSVSISDVGGTRRIAIGVPGFNSQNPLRTDSGLVNVVTEQANGTWGQTAYIEPPVGSGGQNGINGNRQAYAQFGWSVSLSGDHLMVGSPGYDGNSADANTYDYGGAYLYARTGASSWTMTRFMSRDSSSQQSFDSAGWMVAVDSDSSSAFFSIPFGQSSAAPQDAGLIYRVDRSTGDFTGLVSSPPFTQGSDNFGRALTMTGTRVIVGAPRADNGGVDNRGDIFVFDAGDTNSKIRVQGTGVANSFAGWSVDAALSGVAVAGAAGQASPSVDGAVHVLAFGYDCTSNGSIDFPEPIVDCDGNGEHDTCDLQTGVALDCNSNGIPDSCDIASGTSLDCNANGVPDSCDLASATEQDCNGNGIPDSCDIASPLSRDDNGNAVPDECETSPTGGDAISLDGVDDHVDVPDGAYFTGTAFTVEAWVRPDVHASSQRVIDFGNGPASNNIILAASTQTNGRPSATIYVGGNAFTLTAPGINAIPLKQWSHLAMTYNGGANGTLRLYVNGTQVGSRSASAPVNVARTSCFIGRSNFASDAFFDGLIDDVRIWSVARSASDISTWRRLALGGNESGLVANWRFDRVNTTTPDAVTNASATVTGATRWLAREVDLDNDGIIDHAQSPDCNGNLVRDVAEIDANRFGLSATYYDTAAETPVGTLSGATRGRIDPIIDFNWASSAIQPWHSGGSDGIVWTGYVVTPVGVSGNYTFFTQADDGERLYVNNQLIIDQWNTANGERSGVISLQGGTWYKIRLEFGDFAGQASVALRWTPPGQSKVIIPASALRPGRNCNGGSTPDGCSPDSDSDSDGVINACDNCDSTANPEQTDSNSDGVGDACSGGDVYLADALTPPSNVITPQNATINPTDAAFYHTGEQKWYANWRPTLSPVVVTWNLNGGGTQQLTYNVINEVNPESGAVSEVRYHANDVSSFPNGVRPLPVLQNNYNLVVRGNSEVAANEVTTQNTGIAADPACVPTAGSPTVRTVTIADSAFPVAGQINTVILEHNVPGSPARLVGFEVVRIGSFDSSSEQVPIGRKLLPPSELSYTCRARILVNSVAVPSIGAQPVAFQRRPQNESGEIWPIRPNSSDANLQVMWFATSAVVDTQSGDEVFLGHWPEELKRYTTRWPTTGDAAAQINVVNDVTTSPVSLVDLRLENLTAQLPLYCATTDIVMWDADASSVERATNNTNRSQVVNGRFVARASSRTVLKLVPTGQSCTDPDNVTFEVVESYVRGTEPGFNATATNWNVGTPITDALHDVDTPEYPFGYLHRGKPYAPKIYHPEWPAGTPSDEYTGQIIPIAESNTTLWSTAQDLIDRRLEVWYFDESSATTGGNFASGIHWPYRTKRYNLRYQTNLPTTQNLVIASRIGVGVSGNGAGDFSDYDDVRLYRSGIRSDSETIQKTQVGWNPNDEHADFQAIGTGDRLFATRDDNPWSAKVGHPYSLVYFKNDADDVWQTRVFKVVGEQAPFTFNFSQSFSPDGGTTDLLPGIPLNPPLFPINYNIQAPNPCAPGNPEVTLLGDINLNPLWRDKNEQVWLRAPGPGQVRFEEYWGRDGETACTPWRDFRTGNGTTVTFNALRWPDDCTLGGSTPCATPVGVGQTVDPFPVCAVELIWDDADINDGRRVNPRLIDPDLEASAPYAALPPDFSALPPHLASGTDTTGEYLENRIGYDAANLALTYRGIMSHGEWQTLRTPNAPAGWLPTQAFIDSVDELYDNSRLQVTDPQFDPATLSAPKLSFAASSANPGYATFGFNNEPTADCVGFNVAVPIYHVTCPPVAPDVEVFYTQCVFGETVTLRVLNDAGGEPELLAYHWQYRDIGSNDWRNINGVNDGYEIGLRSLVLAGAITLVDRDYRVRYRGYAGCPCGGPSEPACPPIDNSGSDPNDWPYTPTGSVPGASGNAPTGQAYDYGDTAPSAWSGAVHTDGWLKRIVSKLNLFNTPIPVDLDTDGNRLVTALTAVSRVGAPYEGVVSLGCDDAFLSEVGLVIAYESAADRVKLFTVAQRVATVAESLALMFINGHIANLYLIAANEAASDASDPTNGIDPQSAGDPAGLPSNQFAFEGQVPDLLTEELAMLRGTGQTGPSPLWNRLRWNFNITPDGQATYVSTYNITSESNITLADAQLQWPQGHGDAWGHYIDGIKKFYELLRDNNFEWIIINEVIDDTPISYQNERRFARIAAAKARTGAQIVDLTFRDRYTGDPQDDPAYPDPSDADRAWGVDDWAKRAGQGALVDWITLNALMDDADTNPTHQGNIRKVDRTTIGELGELAGAYTEIQATLDNAGGGRTPFGLASNAVPFGIEPSALAGGQSHYEQVRCWAVKQLENAQTIFDYANTVNTRLRRNEDSGQDYQAATQLAEIDRLQRLIELFGKPYPESISDPGGYPADYDGPDVVYWMVVDSSELLGGTTAFHNTANTRTLTRTLIDPQGTLVAAASGSTDLDDYIEEFTFNVSTIGYGVVKPAHWTQRPEPGEIQIARSEVLVAIGELQQSISAYEAHIGNIESEVANWEAIVQTNAEILRIREEFQGTESSLLSSIAALKFFGSVARDAADVAWNIGDAIAEAGPEGIDDFTSFVRAGAKSSGVIAQGISLALANLFDAGAIATENDLQRAGTTAEIQVLIQQQGLESLQQLSVINQLIRDTAVLRAELLTRVEQLNQATGRYQSTLGRAMRLLDEVKVNRLLDVIAANDFRYRDMTFRLLRNDALQKYRAMFDVAARYTFLAARAFDYETNLLGSNPDSAQNAVRAIARARMIGAPPGANFSCTPGSTLPTVVGDNGLSGVLSQLDQVFQGYRVNRDTQALTQTFSIRNDLFGATDAVTWRDALTDSIVPNIKDIREFDGFAALPNPYVAQPALVIPFQTTIQDGLNLFGLQFGGDTFASSYDAVKFLSVKVAVPNLPTAALSRTTIFAYLLPVGTDIMWSPTPSGQEPVLRFWNLIDQALPIPRTAIGFTQPTTSLSDIWTPSDTFTGGAPAAAARRRLPPIDARAAFGAEPANDALLGRSIWNTQWMLIIPSNGLSALPLSLDRKLDILINGGSGEGGISDIQILISG
ncbi:MAG: LamG-like jellyroll fold domain-containing protein, partial [Phycisphaerae bacterium]